MRVTKAPADCPPCAASAEARGRIWQRALKINRDHRPEGKRGTQPLTRTTLAVLDHLLWHAPRGTGALFPSAPTIARAITAGERSVRRATAVLRAWGLLLVHARWRRVPKPVMAGGKVIGVLRVGVRTSNAYSWPDPAKGWPCQTGREAISGFSPYVPKRDIVTGRWLPAPLQRIVDDAGLVWDGKLRRGPGQT